MKKLLLVVISIFSIKVVMADSINETLLPYYVKINDNVIQVKKIYDNDGNVLFNINYKNYDTNGDFQVYEEINKNNYGLRYSSVNYFNTIVAFGYNKVPNDLYYFLTQVLIWDYIDIQTSIVITNELGEEIDDYNTEHNKIVSEFSNYLAATPFQDKTYNSEIWSNTTLTYRNYNPILDNPDIDGLVISNEGLNINIYNEKVGKYDVKLQKEQEQINYSYNDGNNIYWVSLGGPQSLYKSFRYNVYGTKLNIVENLIGINNLVGDSQMNSQYELYLDDELKMTFTDLNDIYVKSNSDYVLKSISDDIGIYKIEDIAFSILEDEYTLVIDKYVISKNMTIKVLDDYTYYIYLKSNDELYSVISKNTDLITLPYGIYYIKNDQGYYKEIEVLDNRDEYLEINNQEEIEIKENKLNIKEEVVTLEEKIIENPKTIDNIDKYIIFLIISFLSLIYINLKEIRHCP